MAARPATAKELPKELAEPLKGVMGEPVGRGAALIESVNEMLPDWER